MYIVDYAFIMPIARYVFLGPKRKRAKIKTEKCNKHRKQDVGLDISIEDNSNGATASSTNAEWGSNQPSPSAGISSLNSENCASGSHSSKGTYVCR